MDKKEKNDRTEKLERLIIIGMVIALWTLAALNSYIPEANNEHEGILRFHVIANSDSKADQELKLGVRDYVLPRIEKEIAAQMTGEEEIDGEIAEKYVENNLERIKKWALRYIRDKGLDYQVTTELGIKAIPAKQYDDIYFPAGNYKALTITIGEGKGQNWWCVVFPPLCLIDCRDSAYKEKFGTDAKDRIVIKSKIKGILKKNQKTESRPEMTKAAESK